MLHVTRIAPHFDEEPCISGTRGSGAIFFSGCNLRCRFCQNSEISYHITGREFTVSKLADAIRALCDTGVHNINFVTPTHYSQHIAQALLLARPLIPVVWNTGGYEKLETLKMLEGFVQIYLPDLKFYSAQTSDQLAEAPDYFAYASAAITQMCRQTGSCVYDADGVMLSGTLVRHLVLPGLTGESIKLLDWIAECLPKGTPVSLMRQYVPVNDMTILGMGRRLTKREYHRVAEHMRALRLPGYTQGKESAEMAYIPAFNAVQSFALND
jgi:putative pyruvate formate lyase activating enzyme